jgi:hypothetical protein
VLPNRKTLLPTLAIIVMALLSSPLAHAQVAQDSTKAKAPTKKWYESIQLRGYSQVRYNRLFETNEDLGCEQCDRSWGKNGGFFLRRVRLIFFGQVNERVYFYIQPDFASSASSTGLHFGQLRDAYFDVGLTKDNSFRVRIGQSKVPYGFENMQSSQNRLPLDRADATNSAVSNERDLGAFFYWAPVKTRQLFSSLVADGLKGSGDYGVFAFGAYNGQTANRPELNNSLHVVSRLSYPFTIGNQIIEPGIQAYTGRFVIPTDQLSSGTKTTGDRNYLDQRVAASLVVYPKPFGIMAEYTVGKGPEFNTATDSIETQDLTGGFVMLNYRIKIKDQNIFPYSRIQYYEGGKKHERDARSYKVNEIESGIEWQPVKNFELVVAYTISSRRYEDKQNPDNKQKGNLMRIQAQLNF